MTTPSDPLYVDQWHFALIGDIETIWDEFDGTGVNVGVYDDGVDFYHEDLTANYDSSLHVVDDLGNPVDPFPVSSGDGHGTACAGLIGAADNGVGGVGVAFGVTLTGVNIDFDNTGVYGSVNAADINPFLDVVGQAANNFDITSHSWGSYPGYFDWSSLLGGDVAQLLDAEYGVLSETGRGGLGTIVVQAAGNDDLDANGSGVNSSRFTITVAATEDTGFAAWYSNFGACILVAAPAAAVTTDLTGGDGYDVGNYTDSFNGTSAATPVVSGVIALMLDANEGLGWRDVQNILAASATVTGSEFDATTADVEEDGLWYSNSATNWNGGGYHVHTNYGYGMVDAYNAVRMAEVWDLFDTAQTSSNEQMVSSGLNDFADTVVPEGTSVPGFTTTFTITEDVLIEHVSLTLDFATTYVGDVRIVLTSPDGTQVVVATESNVSLDVSGNWVFGIESLRGELSTGTWTMEVYDTVALDTLTVRSAQLDVYGSTESVNDVYHFTDEYATMIGFEGARGTISDTNGGIDWLNMAAVTGDITMNLTSGQAFSFDGVVLGTLSGSFENIVAGDGNDRITGTTGANEILGMRGDDTLNGGGGSDTLIGGAGNDTYIVDGGDTVTENANQGTDTVQSSVSFTLGANLENLVLTGSAAINGTGNTLNNRITGDAGNNTLNGGDGNDTLIGGAGNDTYIVNGGDTVTENANQGTDTVQSSVSLTLGANLENLVLTSSAAINGTGNTLNNRITGNAGNNILNGGGGNDTMLGGAGNDTYIVNGGDTVTENANQGTDTVQSSVSFTLGANLEKLVLTGSSNISGTGNTLANTIIGNGGANSLNGGSGSDTLTGGSGADNFIFNTALSSSNVDRITDFNVAADTIRLENAVFTGLAGGTLAASAFVRNTSGNAADASDRIIYESDTGKLYFDKDGTGAAAKVHFATIGTGLAVTSADFFVI